MANINTITDTVKISELPAQTASSPNDIIPTVHSGTTQGANPALFTTDWASLAVLPTVSYNGNRSFSLTYAATNYSGVLSPGKRLRLSRTVAAPTQSASLNGTSQYFNKITPSGMTFTNNFVVGAWVKMTSYNGTDRAIVSRYNGTSGWSLRILSSGAVILLGYNGGSANSSYVASAQVIPLNKWVYVTAQLDMSTFTATTTTSYVMIDGVDVPAIVGRGGTNPTALVQAGNLEIGSENGGTALFPGKIAQVAIFNAKVAQSTMRTYMSQSMAGNETSLIDFYTLSNSINDSNTTNANNLTAQGAATTTNNDSPFGGQADGSISSTLEYGIIEGVSYSTDTVVVVQVPEGCMIPTSGGVTASSYSGIKVPYGLPTQRGKWVVGTYYNNDSSVTTPGAGTWYNINSMRLTLPIGNWRLLYRGSLWADSGANNLASSDLSLTAASSAYISTKLTALSYSTATGHISEHHGFDDYAVSVATVIYLNASVSVASTAIHWFASSNMGGAMIEAENAYL